ncbi:hypothetical protein EON80_02980 [bacterium]|nr:MAG: hypothetical protein EON80_02980 [bacterium]
MIITLEALQEMWQRHECPLLQGVLHLDLGYFPVQVESTCHGAFDYRFTHSVAAPLPLSAIAGLDCTSIDVFASADSKHGTVKCGEGTQGGDGFVALESQDGTLIWVAFFRNSNPFMKLRIEGNDAIATSEYGNPWIFPLDSPQSLRILSPLEE